MAQRSFDDLIREALDAPFTGWDFAFLRGRSRTDPLPWDYRAEVSRLAEHAPTMLDMDTGGGEVLSRLAHRAAFTVATESWPPNVKVAAKRLQPLGIPVVWDEAALDNFDNYGTGRLPFRNETFALVTNRHGAFNGREIARVLRTGGTFVTQQLDHHSYDDFYAALGMEPPDEPESWLPRAVGQIEEAGLDVARAETAVELQHFDDVGVLVYYLGKAVTWAVLGFDVEACMPALRRLHDRMPIQIRQRRFLLVAAKPAAVDAL